MASTIQIAAGTAAPSSLAKSEMAIRHKNGQFTSGDSSMLYLGEDENDNGVTVREFGFGIKGSDSSQSGVAIGKNLVFSTDGIINTTVAAHGSNGSGAVTLSIANDGITAAKLADTSVTAGSYTNASITVDAQGRLTAASSGSSSGVSLANDANNRVVTATGSGGINGEANLTFDGSSLTIAGVSSGAASKLIFDNPDATDDVHLTQGDGGWFGVSADNGSNFNLQFDGSTLALTGNQTISGNLTLAEESAIYFDSTDTFITTNTENPEDLFIGADQDIFLRPDNDVLIQAGTTSYAIFDGANQRVGIGKTDPSVALDVTGAFAVSSNATVGGNLVIDSVISNSSGVIELNAADNIKLDAHTGLIAFEYQGDEFFRVQKSSSSTILQNKTDGGDIIIRQHDGKTNLRIGDDNFVSIGGNDAAQGRLRFYEDSDNGSNFVAIQAAATLGGDTTFTLPTSDGTSGQFLKTDGAGNLSFATVSSSSGDIEGVTAGDGLTGGGSSGSVTLNVVAGDGITMNPNSVSVSAAQTTITSILNENLVVGRGTSHANIDFSTDNEILFDIDGTQQIKFADGSIQPVSDSDIDLGADGKEFKDLYIDGAAYIDSAQIDALSFINETGTMITFGADFDQFITWDNSADYMKWQAKSGADFKLVFGADADALSPDNGDMWLFKVTDGGDFTFGNNKSGSFVTHFGILPNATVTNSTFAIAGHATVGHDLTVTGDLAVTGSYGLVSNDIPNNAADTTGNAATATALATARAFQTNLASTSSANFDGSAANTHGVTGTLAVGNGGTGVTSMTSLKDALDDETWTFANVLTADAGIDVDGLHIDDNAITRSSGALKLSAPTFNFHSPDAGANVITISDPSANDIGGTNHGYAMRIKGTNSNGGGMLVFGGASDSTANTVTGFRAPNVLPQSLIYELPDDVPSAGEYLKVASYSSPVAQLEWASASGGGGSIDGSGAANRVSFWEDSDTLSSDSGLTYDGTTLAVTGTGSEATFIKARSEANNSSSLDGPRIDLDRYPSSDPGADGDELGRMRFNGKTGGDASRTFGSFMCSIVDAGPSNSYASGKFTFQARINGATRDIFSAGSTGPNDGTQQKGVFPEDDNDVDLGTSSKGWERVYSRTYFTHDGSSYIEGAGEQIEGVSGTSGGQSVNMILAVNNGIVTTMAMMQGSDEGIKTDIADAGTGLSLINNLKPKTFKYKDDFRAAYSLTGESKTQYGFIAQDLQTISSDYVNTVTDPRDENETILAIDEKFEGELKASLIKAIQELSAKNDALEARIAALEG